MWLLVVQSKWAPVISQALGCACIYYYPNFAFKDVDHAADRMLKNADHALKDMRKELKYDTEERKPNVDEVRHQ